jgi:hypothetical protein
MKNSAGFYEDAIPLMNSSEFYLKVKLAEKAVA